MLLVQFLAHVVLCTVVEDVVGLHSWAGHVGPQGTRGMYDIREYYVGECCYRIPAHTLRVTYECSNDYKCPDEVDDGDYDECILFGPADVTCYKYDRTTTQMLETCNIDCCKSEHGLFDSGCFDMYPNLVAYTGYDIDPGVLGPDHSQNLTLPCEDTGEDGVDGHPGSHCIWNPMLLKYVCDKELDEEAGVAGPQGPFDDVHDVIDLALLEPVYSDIYCPLLAECERECVTDPSYLSYYIKEGVVESDYVASDLHSICKNICRMEFNMDEYFRC